MNNKGFAISTMLYGLIIIILLVMLMILSIMAFNRKHSKEFSALIRDDLEQKEFVSTSKFFQLFTYSESSSNTCIKGNEPTCVAIGANDNPCYKNKIANACHVGDIVRYRVNDTDTVTFHILKDDANTITMQTQKNVIYSVPWISALDYSGTITYKNDRGPLTVLSSPSDSQNIEGVTSSWTNVNTLAYSFNTSSGCSAYNACSTATYNLTKNNVKARMITLQEAYAAGCKPSCPKWMYNYLQNSTASGGIINDEEHGMASENNYGYWTMSAYSGTDSTCTDGKCAWFIEQTGKAVYKNIQEVDYGARAVVVVNKE